MNITFRQMRLFLAVAETGSVSAAARALHVTQPTASAQLREITEAVGMPVYEVIAKKIYLTEIGRELAHTARIMVGEWEGFEQSVAAAKGLSRGKLRVAIVSTAKYFVPRMIGTFCEKHPAIDVALEILNRDGVVQRLKENLDDLYIMSMPPAGIDLDDAVFMTNPLVAISASGDPLANQPSIALSELNGRRFILREPGSGTRMAADQHFRQAKFRPEVRMELGSNEAIKEAVAGGLGIGVVSAHALHGLQKEHGVVTLAVQSFPIASQWHMVHPRAKRLSPIAAAFKDYLLGCAAESP